MEARWSRKSIERAIFGSTCQRYQSPRKHPPINIAHGLDFALSRCWRFCWLILLETQSWCWAIPLLCKKISVLDTWSLVYRHQIHKITLGSSRVKSYLGTRQRWIFFPWWPALLQYGVWRSADRRLRRTSQQIVLLFGKKVVFLSLEVYSG